MVHEPIRVRDLSQERRLDKQWVRIGATEGMLNWDGFFTGDDTSVDDKNKVRENLSKNPFIYNDTTIPPREALYVDWDIVAKTTQPEENDGLTAIKQWRELYDTPLMNAYGAPMNIPSLKNLVIDGGMYFGLYGEAMFQLQYLKSPLLKSLGFVRGEMLRKISMFSPLQVDEVSKNNEGDVSELRIWTKDHGLETIKSEEKLSKLVILINRPVCEMRGISPLSPSLNWILGYDDIKELNIGIIYNTARPLEVHKIDMNKYGPRNRDEAVSDYQTMLKAFEGKQNRSLIQDHSEDFQIHGYQHKTLELYNDLLRWMDDIYGAINTPSGFIHGKNVSKATMDVQRERYHTTKLKAYYQWFANLLLPGQIFPRVLYDMGKDLTLVPTLKFPPYQVASPLEQAMIDEIYSTLLPRYKEKLADELGVEFDPEEEQQRQEQAKRVGVVVKEDGSEAQILGFPDGGI
jgi:hypothetical protein